MATRKALKLSPDDQGALALAIMSLLADPTDVQDLYIPSEWYQGQRNGGYDSIKEAILELFNRTINWSESALLEWLQNIMQPVAWTIQESIPSITKALHRFAEVNELSPQLADAMQQFCDRFSNLRRGQYFKYSTQLQALIYSGKLVIPIQSLEDWTELANKDLEIIKDSSTQQVWNVC